MTYKTTELFIGYRFSNANPTQISTDNFFWWDITGNKSVIVISDEVMVYNMTTEKFTKDNFEHFSNYIKVEYGDLTEILGSGIVESDYPFNITSHIVNRTSREIVITMGSNNIEDNFNLKVNEVLEMDLLFNFNIFEPQIEVRKCWVSDDHDFTMYRQSGGVCEYPKRIIKGIPLS